MASSLSNILAGAKAAESKASDLTKSVEGKSTSRFAAKPKPTGTFSTAPYKAAHSASSSLMDEAKSAAEGLKAKQDNIDQYEAATK